VRTQQNDNAHRNSEKKSGVKRNAVCKLLRKNPESPHRAQKRGKRKKLIQEARREESPCDLSEGAPQRESLETGEK